LSRAVPQLEASRLAPGGGPVLVAHRGWPARHPELSAASLSAARDAGAAVVELDVRPTRDGLLVVLHDPSPERVTGESRPAAECDAAELLAQRYTRAPGESLLLFDEALALLAGRCAIDVEIKPDPACSSEDLARRTVEALIRAGSPREVVATSESVDVLRDVRALAPALPTGLVLRSGARLDAVRAASDADAGLVVANAKRVDDALASRCREAGIQLWAYAIRDAEHARRLVRDGCGGLVVDDLPATRDDLRARGLLGDDEHDADRGGPRVLVVDLGSSSTKAALVSPRSGIVAQRARATPARTGDGRVEHDADEVLECVDELLDELARAVAPGAPPAAAAFAAQRSTGLFMRRGDGAALTPAISWRDERGDDVVASFGDRREELEREAGLELARAWTAVRGAILLGGRRPADDAVLVPLASYVHAKLTGSSPRVDPTLGNRTFLMRARDAAWSDLLLDAFGLARRHVPELVPTVADHGTLPWPGSTGRVPVRALAGDQPCAYVGAAGPMGKRLVLNGGTAGFVMRTGTPGESLPAGARLSPLWTSERRPVPAVWLIELPVIAPPGADPGGTRDDAARAVARREALGGDSSADAVSRLAEAVTKVRQASDQSVLVTGGILASPHLLAALRKSLRVPMMRAAEPETTTLGAARLAATGARLGWSLPDAGGVALEDLLSL
jgi:glycerophosphoryl diester phosphodiesterase/glycerol kinase